MVQNILTALKMSNIYIASYNRFNCVRTFDYLGMGNIVVPESQADDYRKHYGKAVMVIPDSKDGSVSKKRNAILELIKEQQPDGYGWILDDDIKHIKRKKEDVNLEPDDAIQLMEKLEIMAKDMGAYYGGFEYNADMMKFKDMAPFSVNKIIYHMTLINVNDGLQYDERLRIGEDVDFYLQKLNLHRRLIKDNQYCVETFGEDGGAESVIKYTKADQRYYATMINNKWGYKAMEWKKTSFKFNTPIKGI